jgi:putative membrane protein
MMDETRDRSGWLFDDTGTELSSRRTGMSFQRTRMSADRTLMSVIRTALSLISFGFTIYQLFAKLLHKEGEGVAPARNFGLALVVLGVTMLVFGIIYHLRFMAGLRTTRNTLEAGGLIHGQSHFPVSLTLIVAILLLLTGIGAFVSLAFRVGPFG